MKQDRALKLLASHVGKDVTRYHLTGVYFDKGKVVATDGHRMVVIEEEHAIELKHLFSRYEGKIYSFKDHVVIDRKFPAWKQLVPVVDEKCASLKITLPTWLASVKLPKRGRHENVFITLNGLQLWKPESDALWIAVQLAYLAPYAGDEVTLSWKNTASPLVVKHETYTAVVMPVRV